jgi:outer membrane biosynthesis protein TonB
LDYDLKRGITASGILHGLMFIAIMLGVPSMLNKDPMDVPLPMVVEIVPIGAKTNIAQQEKQIKQDKVKPKEEPPKPKEVEKQEEPKQPEPLPEPEPKKPEPVKEAIAEKPKEDEKPKEEKKPEKPKEEPKKDEKKADDEFENILKNLAATSSDTNKKEVKNTEYDPNQQLSVTELDALNARFNQHMKPCWNMPAGIMDAHKMVVNLKITMLPDGRVQDVQITDTMRYSTDPGFRAAAESAVRAVRLCAPYDKILPMDKYAAWREIDMDFDPSSLLY